jgi:hypothetical protein
MMMSRSNYTPIECTIMAHQNMMQQKAITSNENMHTIMPSLKRKFETQKKINYAQPPIAAIDDLIKSYASSTSRWLDVERDAVSFVLVAQLNPALLVCASRDKRKLVLQNCMYTLCNTINAKRPDVRFIEEDMSLVLSADASRLPFDLITCVMSLHRFFNAEESATNFFTNVASCLDEDGHFICVFRSGSELLPEVDDEANEDNHVQKKSRFYDPLEEAGLDTASVLKNLLQTLKETKKKPVYTRFGSPLPEGVEVHRDAEVLVFRNIVLGVAKSCGLVPVVDYPVELSAAHYESKDRREAFKHFRDTCYGSIVFKKKKAKLISIL